MSSPSHFPPPQSISLLGSAIYQALLGAPRFCERSENRVHRDCPYLYRNSLNAPATVSCSQWKWPAKPMSRSDAYPPHFLADGMIHYVVIARIETASASEAQIKEKEFRIEYVEVHGRRPVRDLKDQPYAVLWILYAGLAKRDSGRFCHARRMNHMTPIVADRLATLVLRLRTTNTHRQIRNGSDTLLKRHAAAVHMSTKLSCQVLRPKSILKSL